jgi:hypothetical protein
MLHAYVKSSVRKPYGMVPRLGSCGEDETYGHNGRRVRAALHDHAASSAPHDRAASVKGSTPRCLGRQPDAALAKGSTPRCLGRVARRRLGEGLYAALPWPPSLAASPRLGCLPRRRPLPSCPNRRA